MVFVDLRKIHLMKKILTLLILLFILLSCEKKEDSFSDEIIEKLVIHNEINDLPPPNSFLDLYVLTDNNEIMSTDNYSLYKLYNAYYYKNFKNFKEFLDEVLNQNHVIEKRFFKNKFYLDSFKLNRNIEKKYSEIGFDEFLKKYSEKTASNRTKLKKTIINENEYLTVVYLLYKNKYDISRDCYIGNDYIIKREDYFNPSK